MMTPTFSVIERDGDTYMEIEVANIVVARVDVTDYDDRYDLRNSLRAAAEALEENYDE